MMLYNIHCYIVVKVGEGCKVYLLKNTSLSSTLHTVYGKHAQDKTFTFWEQNHIYSKTFTVAFL